MKISLSLIKKFFPLDKSAADIADMLTMLGLEVDALVNEVPTFSGVVVGEVSSTSPHPKNENLCIAQVTDKKNAYQVICGAPNCRAGLKVAFANIGAKLTLKDGNILEIKKKSIQGIESHGMLCSASELNLFDESEGILELDEEFTVGEDLAKKLHDPIFDISLTPNLGHCMSALGVARELAAWQKKQISPLKVVCSEEPSDSAIQVKVSAQNLCSRYACKIVENIQIAPSPFWLKKQLMQCGIRSINNIVDVTNLVMLELGQPLHAFDLDKIDGKTIEVSVTEKEQKFLGLDDKEYLLSKDTLVIKDTQKILALAGVMGGGDSAVNDHSRHIVLEAAHFSDTAVRRSAKQCNLRTESSQRFEKGVDRQMIDLALDYAATLLQKIAQGKVYKVVQWKAKEEKVKEIKLRKKRVTLILGHAFSLSEIQEILKTIGLTPHVIDTETLLVKIPTYRNDLNEEIDLIEEIARMYGYNNIEKKDPLYKSSKLSFSPMFLLENETRKVLISENLTEVLNSDLISPKLAELLQEEELSKDTFIKVRHSKSEEYSVLRPSLLCALLQNIRHNLDRKNQNLPFFEIGRINFLKDHRFIEQTMVAIALSGKKTPEYFEMPSKEVDFFDLKGMVENLFSALHIEKVLFKASKHWNFHPNRQAGIHHEGLDLGVLGELRPELLEKLDIKQRVYFCEINLNLLLHIPKPEVTYQLLPLFPGSDRDWTITIQKSLPISEIFQAIESFRPEILEEVSLVSIFESDQIGKDKKNITLRFFYRDSKGTISYEITEQNHKELQEKVSRHLKIA